MQLIRTIHSRNKDPLGNSPVDSTGTVATIGNFDGVHLGHQFVINKIIQQSKALGLPSMVISFEPSAKEFFLANQAPARLTNFREKFSLLDRFGIDRFVCLKFNHDLSSMPAETFIKNILVEKLQIKHLTVGDNFRFGKDRKGDLELLKNFSEKLNYIVEDTNSFINDGKRVSSTSIREFLNQGNLEAATKMLGRKYSMSGHVIHGDKKGRTIGFPTANIPIRRKNCAINGVFAVTITRADGSEHTGVANIGHRPTVGGTRTQLEVHLFNFSDQVYGEFLKVTFYKKLRNEKKFDSFDALKNQIKQDAKSAQDFFSIAA
jgi:riboflavin kinase/FMN adenylyltransferase